MWLHKIYDLYVTLTLPSTELCEAFKKLSKQ